MSRDSESGGGGGLGALLGGYGSDSDAPAEAPAPAGTGAAGTRGADAGATGGGHGLSQPVTDTGEAREAELDPLPAGPARGPRAPSPGAAPSGPEEGHFGDPGEDAPAAGPARPSAVDLASAHAAYDDVRSRTYLRSERTHSERAHSEDVAGPSHLRDGHQPDDADAVASGSSPRVAARSRRLARSAPSCYLNGVCVPTRRAVLGARAEEEVKSASLDEKMRKWMALRLNGVRVNDSLRQSKGFRNPDFLSSAVSRFGIDERATMFSKDVFDPNLIADKKEDHYDSLALAQKRLAERRERERKAAGPNRVVQFRSAAAERAAAAAAAAAEEVTRRKRGRGA
jgi:hypothetical protein